MSRASSYPFWMTVHRWSGLGSMLFLFLAAVTGCLLCVDKSIDAALNADLFDVPASAHPLDAVAAVARFERAHPHLRVTSFPLRIEPGTTIRAMVAPRAGSPAPGFDEAFIDPADGRLVGSRDSGPGLDRRHIVKAIYEFHYTLLAGTAGRWLMGLMAAAWLIGSGVGFYLTLPLKKPFLRKWRRAWAIDWKGRLRWLMLDLHRASGLWLLPGVMVLAFTSVAMNFYDEAYEPVVLSLSPARLSVFDHPPPKLPGPELIGFRQALAAAARAAMQRGLAWQPASASYLPARNLYGIAFTASGRVEYRQLGPVTLYLDGAGGRLVYADDPYADSTGRQLSRVLYPLHSGEVIGPLGTAVIFLLGLATAEMCVSGFYLWWKKRQSRRAIERASRPERALA